MTSPPPSLPSRLIPQPASLHDEGYTEDVQNRDTSCHVSGILDFCEQAAPGPGERQRVVAPQHGRDQRLGDSFGNERDTAAGGPAPVVRRRLHNVEMQKLVGVDRRCVLVWRGRCCHYSVNDDWDLHQRGRKRLRQSDR